MPYRLYIYGCVLALTIVVITCGFAWWLQLPEEYLWLLLSLLFALAAERAFGLTDLLLSITLKDTRGTLIDYAEAGIPRQSSTAIIVPLLLHSADQIVRVVATAKWNITIANDTNVCLVLVADLPDATTRAEVPEELELIAMLRRAVREVNSELGSAYDNPISLIYRPRVFVAEQDCWMGAERKLGKIELVADLISGIERNDAVYDPVTATRLHAAKYMLVLDEDSKLTPNTVQWLAGFLDHPCNTPTVDASGKLRGHAIAVCQSVVDPVSASRWRLSRSIVGQRINPAMSPPAGMSFHFEWFGQARFNGKGLIEPRVYRQVMRGRLPRNLVLSHDTVEAAYLKSGFVGVGGITESFPGSHEAILARNLRWMRGDLQNAYLALVVQGHGGSQGGGFPVLGLLNIAQQVVHYVCNLALFPFVLITCLGEPSVQRISAMVMFIGLGSYERLVVNAIRDFRNRMPIRRALAIYPGYFLRMHIAIMHGIMLAPANFYVACAALVRVTRGLLTKKALLVWQTAAAADSGKARSHYCAVGSFLGLLGVSSALLIGKWGWGVMALGCIWACLAVADDLLLRGEADARQI